MVAVLLCACNLARPQVTLTLAPLQTRDSTLRAASPTPQITATEMATATATVAARAEIDSLPSPSPTRIQPRSATPTRSPASATQTGPAPTPTPLPADQATDPAQPAATSTRASNLPPTWTAAPTARPTARQNAASPTAGATRENLGLAPRRPTQTPTRFQPTVALRRELIIEEIPPPRFESAAFDTGAAALYEYDLGGAGFDFAGLSIAGDVVLFAPNPAAGDSYLLTDLRGLLRYRPPGATGEMEFVYSPFFAGFHAPSADANKNRVVEIDWSADGSEFSFRIDTPPGLDNASAGVWYWQPGRELQTDPTYALIHDCPDAGALSCGLARASNASHWKTVDVAWSPIAGRKELLLRVELPDEGRNALAIVEARRDARYADQAPHFVRYDTGHFSADGDEIVVSGRRADGRVVIALVDSRLRKERLIFDATAAGLWLQDAVRLSDGRIVALGKRGSPDDGAPLALYDSAGTALSAPIGDAAPDAVRWHPDRHSVALRIGDRQYTAWVDGGRISDRTGLTRDPSFRQNAPNSPIPNAVIQGSAYRPGQQLRALVNLNLRAAPATSSAIIGGLFSGDYLAIIAGPYRSQDIVWWRVQTAADALGWVAGEISGRATIGMVR